MVSIMIMDECFVGDGWRLREVGCVDGGLLGCVREVVM